MRTKGGLTRDEEARLRVVDLVPKMTNVLFSGLGSYVGWFGVSLGNKLLGYPHGPHTSGLRRFCAAIGCAYLMGEGFYRVILYTCPVVVLDTDKGRMKMELANIILTKHSDDLFLVDAVKRNFFAEHLFDDLHQDQPLFRWHPRRSYTDSAFVERMKEIEATNSDDEARSVSRATTANNRPLGDLMEDPLACILGSPGDDVESNNPAENTSTVLKPRSELRARRRSHRHHHYRIVGDNMTRATCRTDGTNSSNQVSGLKGEPKPSLRAQRDLETLWMNPPPSSPWECSIQ